MNTELSTETIWRELSDRLRQFVLCRVPSAHVADDIVQRVFLQIHQKLPTLRDDQKLESWVFQIARNAIVDYYRATAKHASITQADIAAMYAQNGDQVGNRNRQIASCVRALVSQLPVEQRRAVTLYELEGVSQNTIAQREAISVSGAKSRIQRGRKALLKMLGDCCEFELDRRGNVIEINSSCGCSDGSDRCSCS